MSRVNKISRRLLVCMSTFPSAFGQDSDSNNSADYQRDIAPIFQQYCLPCHNPNSRAGGLDLKTRQAAEQGGATLDWFS